jgi:hypothetical protein
LPAGVRRQAAGVLPQARLLPSCGVAFLAALPEVAGVVDGGEIRHRVIVTGDEVIDLGCSRSTAHVADALVSPHHPPLDELPVGRETLCSVATCPWDTWVDRARLQVRTS